MKTLKIRSPKTILLAFTMVILLPFAFGNSYSKSFQSLEGLSLLDFLVVEKAPKSKMDIIQTKHFNDSDCDGVPDALDQCPGGDDSIDSDNDGTPDCADWDGFSNLPNEWKCGNNKVTICHIPAGNAENAHDICVNSNSVSSHLNQGDYLGSCFTVSCNDNGGDCCFPGVATDNTLTGDGNLGNELSVNISNDANNQLALGTDGALFVAPSVGNPTDELQTLIRSANNVTLSNSGGTVSIEDDDSDPANEIQTLSISGNELSITGGNTVILPNNVDDADADPTNEFNTSLNLSGSNLELTDDGGTLSVDLGTLPDAVDDADADPGNEIQNLQFNNNTLSLSDDPTPVDLSPYLDNTDNQTLSFSGDNLSIFSGNTVDLSGLKDADWLKLDGTLPSSIIDDIYTNGKVGINTSSPNSELEVMGLIGASRVTVGNTAVANASKIHIAGTSNVDIRFDNTSGYSYNLLNDGVNMRLVNVTDNETPFSILNSGTSLIDLPTNTQVGLDINGDNPSQVTMLLHNTSPSGNNWHIRSGGSSTAVTNGSLVFDTGISTTERRFVLTPNTEVGINYGLPNAQLHVRGKDISSGTSNLLLENNNGVPLVDVKNNGFIGVGTSTPLAAIHIERDIPDIRFERPALAPGFRFYMSEGTDGRNIMKLHPTSAGIGLSVHSQTGTIGIGILSDPDIEHTMQIRQIGGAEHGILIEDTDGTDKVDLWTARNTNSGTQPNTNQLIEDDFYWNQVSSNLHFGKFNGVSQWNDFLMFERSSGFTGIGSFATGSNNGASAFSAPQAQLHVIGSGTNATTVAARIDDNDGTSLMYVRNDGNIGLGTITPSEKLHVAGNVFADGGIFITSDKYFKKDIRKLENVIPKLQKLDGVSYLFKIEEFKDRGFTDAPQLGLIAQDLEEVFPELVKTYEDGYKAVNYEGLIPVLIEGIKDQQRQISKLEKEKTQVFEEMEELKKMVQQLKSEYEQIGNTINRSRVDLSSIQSIILDQNTPNPFKERTTIRYVVPDTTDDAQIFIFDQTGKIMKKVNLEKGEGILEVYASNLNSGIYTYSLILNGKVVESKKMILGK